MACLNFRSFRLDRLLYNTSAAKTILPNVFKNTVFTSRKVSSYSYVDLSAIRRSFTTPKFYQASGVKFYSTEKSTSQNPQETPADDEEEKLKREKAWKRMKLSLIILGSFFGASFVWSFYVLGSPDRDENGNDIEDPFSHMPYVQQWCSRFYDKIRFYKKMIQEPSQSKLLPDPVEYPYIQPPYTLVIELTDVLVHPDWTYQTGWRFKKRPHVDAFLEQVASPLFEIVIFTAEQAMTMVPIVNQLNKNQLIYGSLFRDSTDFRNGHHIKNLNWLNRDLSKVIVVDWDPQSVKLHPENALIIPRWKGNDDDSTLIDLAAFLKTIAFNKVEDVRDVLSYYQQFPDPIAKFRENQQILLEQMEEQERLEQARKEHPPLTRRFAKSYVSR